MYELSKVYIKIDERNRILAIEGGYSIGNITDIENWILIDEGSGDKYNLCQSNYLPKPVLEEHIVPQFEYIDSQVVPRTASAIAEDIRAASIIRAPHNVLADEFFSIGGMLYRALENIPATEPIIVGQNVIETTIEAQLAKLREENKK